MAIDKLIPQYLNSDTDQKLVKSVEMTDNLNVRISNDAEGTAGVVKNVKGNESVSPRNSSDNVPSGDNRVIGSIANEHNKEILFLVWNSAGNHGIYRIDLTTNKYQKLYEDSVLNFKKYSYAKCDVIINEDEDTLFYWTDNDNPPMKLNIQRLIRGGYPSSLTSGTDAEKLLCLTTAKQPPKLAPTYNIVNNPTLIQNNIKRSVFQFAYKYVYEDGEHSALSPYSSLTVAVSQLRDGLNSEEQKEFYNQINVFVKNSVADVKDIILYAREGNGTFYQAKKVSNSTSGGTRTIEFTNDTLGSPLANNELNKPYDNVPQVAKAQAIVGNRLMYGNYIEGYDNVDTDVEMLANYGNIPDVYNITLTAYDSELNGRGFTLDLSSLPSTFSDASTIHLNISYEQKDVEIDKNGLLNVLLDTWVKYYNDNDDTDRETKEFTISVAKGGIHGHLSGIIFKESISVAAGSTMTDVRALIVSKLDQTYRTAVFSPKEGEESYTILNTWGSTPFTTQSGRFEGEVKFKLNAFNVGTEQVRVKVNPQEATLRLVDFFATGSKKVEIIETETAVVDLTGSSYQPYGGFQEVDITINNGGSFAAKYLDGGKTFKSGSAHKMGVVYFDNRGRAGGVQEAGDVYVNHLNDRSNEDDLYGRASIIMRLKHSAPSWARTWMPVYVGKGETEAKLVYSVKGAFLPKSTGETSGFSIQDTIYLSLNSLFQKPDSYTKATGADIEYQFEKGDRLRIVEYDGGLRTKKEFEVVDHRTLVNDLDTNPILSRRSKDAIEATTGDFLVIKNNATAPSFNTSSVANDSSGWFKRCVVEIFRKDKKTEDRVYYELGKVYDCNSGTHSDMRNFTSLNAQIDSNSNGIAFAQTAVRLFKGDILTTSAGSLTVRNVYKEGSTYYFYADDNNATPLSLTTYAFTVSNPDAVIDLNVGDSYFRPRVMFTKEEQIDDTDFVKANIISSMVKYVEDYSVSDFFDSKFGSTGRPFAHIPEAKRLRRRASITYSDPFVIDSDKLNLSSFNLSLANWSDVDIKYGGIDSLINRADSLTCLQDSKASQIPVNRNVIEYANGQAGVTVSRNVLSQPSYYAGDFGTSGNPESVVERFGVVYYADAKAGKIVRLSTDGITLISDKGMNSFFEDKFKSLLSITEKIRVVGGFDPDNDEYLVTVEPVYNSQLTIGSDTNNIPVDADAEFTIQGITYVQNTVLWNVWGNVWNTFCGDWDDVGNGVVFVDSAFNAQGVVVDLSYLGSTATIDVLITDSSYSFSAIGQVNLSTGQITLPSTTCQGDSITVGAATEKEEGFTVSYKHKEGVWGSKYSFKPTSYANINNDLYSFFDNEDNRLVWEHNVNTTRNNFYNTQYDSMVEVVSNRNPSMIKVYEAMAVEGNGTWSATVSNSEQSTTIGTSDFDVREGHRYAMIPRDTLKSTEHQIYLGKVDSVSGDKVTFTTPINSIPFVVGDVLKTASGSTLTGTGMEISGIDGRKTIQCTTNISNISAGDNVFVEHAARVDGDPMRDVFLKIKIESSDTTPFEVHALSTHFDRSRLHNDRVN